MNILFEGLLILKVLSLNVPVVFKNFAALSVGIVRICKRFDRNRLKA
jgi:hypothetical protein